MAERSLAWYWRRLRNMAPREIAHRVVERARKTHARGREEGWARYANDGPVPVLPGLADAVDRSPRRWREAVAAHAQGPASGRFAALGVDWPDAGTDAPFPPQRWQLDPVTGGLWPGSQAYCFDVAYRHERVLGDIKYVWEFNRLQFLQPMALHARLYRDSRMASLIEAAVESWFVANPPFRGVAWCSGIELALRSISLLVVCSLCADQLTPASAARLRAMLHAHLHWMRRYPSLHSSANNHRVAEAAGEFLVALAMPELPTADPARRAAQQVLETEALLQILPDGCGAEQSPTYAAFTAEFLLLACFVGRAAGYPLAGAAEDRLRSFAEAIDLLSVPGGRPPSIGDDDEGRVLTDTRHEPDYAVAVARAVAAFTAGRSASAPGARPVLRDLVFGEAAPQAAGDETACRRDLADGGYAVVRERRAGRALHLVVDHGPLGYLSIAAHGHADALSVCLALDGTPVLVDPGTYLYHAGGAWRDWFRGTAAHNTLTVRGADQSQITGPFNWGERAHARLDAFDPGPDWRIVASHDGYRRRLGVVHRREVMARPSGVAIVDRLEGSGPQPGEIVFQLAPGLDVRREGSRVEVVREGRSLAALRFDDRGEITLSRGGDAMQGGWVSPAFGRLEPAWRLAWCGPVGAGGVRTEVDWG